MSARRPVSCLRRFAPLFALLPFAAALALVDLGGPALWEDEGDTAVYARSILEFGVPRAWDGHSFSDSDDGLRVAPRALGQDLVMVGTPWLPYYVTAASFAAFGESEWAARLPFALAAIGTVAMLYAFVLRATGCMRAAFAASLLLIASAQFQLYARESRSYALNMLLTLAVLWGFLRLGERRRDPWLAVAAIALFHVQPLPAALALGACALVALSSASSRPRLRPLLARAPLVIALTLPWVAISWSAAGANWKPIEHAGELAGRVAQLGAESTLMIPYLGWAIGLPLVWRRLEAGDRTLLQLVVAWLALCVALVPLVLSAKLLVVVGLRYACALLPLSAAVTGLVIARAAAGRNALYAGLLALFAATHLAGNALPWLALGETQRVADVAAVNVARRLPDKLLNTQWWAFVRGLGVRDPGTLPAIVELLKENAEPGQVVLTNFGWDNLYFYTRLPQAMRISPKAPVREAALALGLPRYVFGPDGADWVVWRGGAGAVIGDSLEQVRSELAARGATLEPVATLRETLWENRPELQWHRFPRVGYPFAPRRMGAEGARYPDAQVFRVHWPARDGGAGPRSEAPP
ncbi:MAG TPA: glycosyltransferase family 39 protein [Myxococcota bacterium]|nr:glycosyltransferase family 39 protein [Myxococcota bacterium]